MKYKLLALDIDGTLIGDDSVVRPEVIEALHAARKAGLRVCLASGRSYADAIPIWRQLKLEEPSAAGAVEPLVLLGGALVSEGPTGRTLYQRSIERGLAWQFARALFERGYCVLAAMDPWRHGLDYAHTHEGSGAETIRKWVARGKLSVRVLDGQLAGAGRQAKLDALPVPLRISCVVDPAHAPRVVAELRAQFGDRLNIHAMYIPVYDFTVLEAFSLAANKLAAVVYVAQAYCASAAQVVAVGDDVNDLPMLKGVGLGVAMPQASDEVRAAAKHVAHGGLAKFIHELLDGRFA